MNDKNKGLYQKYKVERVDGKEVNDAIVLEFKDPHAREGIRAFRDSVLIDGYQALACDLTYKLEEYERKYELIFFQIFNEVCFNITFDNSIYLSKERISIGKMEITPELYRYKDLDYISINQEIFDQLYNLIEKVAFIAEDKKITYNNKKEE